MATDYEKFYQENKNGLGEPTKEFTEFFKNYPKKNARVLDVGCGQGRDALFIARRGHAVIAVDNAPTGIEDFRQAAAKEDLKIQCEVVDITKANYEGVFDIIVIDRTLHMLPDDDVRHEAFRTILAHMDKGSHILIADERSNLPGLKACLESSALNYEYTLEKRGFLFARAC